MKTLRPLGAATATAATIAAIAPLILAAAPVLGQAPPPPLPPSTPWVGPADYAQFVPESETKKLAVTVGTIDDAPGGPKPGLRFTVSEQGSTPIAVQARVVAPVGADAGDVMLAHFYMRTVKSQQESGEGIATLIVERPVTFEKSVAYIAKAPIAWKEFNIPFTMKGAFKPNEARVAFRVGFQRQTIEIAGLEIRDFHRAAIGSLPATKIDYSYAGMEPDAPWRAEADARIQKYRKSPLTVQVVDAGGRPVPGARVEVQQTRHAFGFGSAATAEKFLAPPGPDGHNHYADAILENFNLVTIDNALKWPRWEQDREVALRAAHWVKDHDITLRGHNLVWPGWRHLPASLKPLTANPDEMRAATLRHVEEETAALAPYTSVWDVINETYDNHDLMDICGEHILVDIFQAAKKAAPKSVLMINDYSILANGGLDLPHQASYSKVIGYLQAQHAPLEGIGMQGHFGDDLTPPTRALEILDRYAAFHLPIQITEFTMGAEDPSFVVRYTRDLMTVCFSHPSVDAFVFWGFYAGQDFPHQADLFDAAGHLTPVGKAWRELVFAKWWTHENAVAGADGSVNVSGFHGRYTVSVARGGGQPAVVRTVELQPGGTTVKVVLGN